VIVAPSRVERKGLRLSQRPRLSKFARRIGRHINGRKPVPGRGFLLHDWRRCQYGRYRFITNPSWNCASRAQIAMGLTASPSCRPPNGTHCSSRTGERIQSVEAMRRLCQGSSTVQCVPGFRCTCATWVGKRLARCSALLPRAERKTIYAICRQNLTCPPHALADLPAA